MVHSSVMKTRLAQQSNYKAINNSRSDAALLTPINLVLFDYRSAYLFEHKSDLEVDRD